MVDNFDSDLDTSGVTATPSQGSCNSGTNPLSCSFGNIAADTTVTITVGGLTVNDGAAINGSTTEISNTASVSTLGNEANDTTDTPWTTDVDHKLGDACPASSDCFSGFCVDGVCCESACTTLCQACSNALTGLANGQCENIVATNPTPTRCRRSARQPPAVRTLTAACATALPARAAAWCSNGSACTADANCVSGNCECTDPACSARICSAVNDADGTTCAAAFCRGQQLNYADTCMSGACTDGGTLSCSGPNDGDNDCQESCDATAQTCTGNDPDGSDCVIGSGTGKCVGGTGCWFLSATSQGCDTTCASIGASCSDTGPTRTFAGSAGTNANCEAVLTALGRPGAVNDISCAPGFEAGCHDHTIDGNTRCAGVNPTECADFNADWERACTCQ